MSPSPGERPPGSVRLEGATRATEIFLIDSTFVLRRRALGLLEGEFPAGIYKARHQLGSEVWDDRFEIRSGELEVRRGPRVIARSPAPLPSTGLRRVKGGLVEMDAGQRKRWWARAGEVRPSRGQGVLHLVLRAAKAYPSYEVRVRSLDEKGPEEVARWDGADGLEPRLFRLPSGTYVLSVADGEGRLCRAVPVRPGHQTVVSLAAPPPGRGLAGALADSSLLFLPHPVDGDDEALLLQELAQQTLRRSREYLEAPALAGGRDVSPWLRLLAAHGLIEAARARARRPHDPIDLAPAALEAVAATHRALQGTALGGTTDAAALGLFGDRPPDPVNLDEPPVLAAAWRTLVSRSLDPERSRVIQGGGRILRMAAHLRTSSLWFLWWERDPESAQAEARLDLASSVEQLLEPQLRPNAGRMPSWSAGPPRMADVAEANAQRLARRLQLPIPLVLSLGRQLDEDRLRAAGKRAQQRKDALAAQAPVALVVLPDGVRMDPSHGQPIDLEAVFDVVDQAVWALGVAAVRAPPVTADSKEMVKALANADLLVADLGFDDRDVREVAEAWPRGLIALCAEGQQVKAPRGAKLVKYRASFGTGISLAHPERLAAALRGVRRGASRRPERDRWIQHVVQSEQRQLQLRRLRAGLGQSRAPISSLLSDKSFHAALEQESAAVQRDVFLLLRSCSDWEGMVRSVEAMAPELRKTVLVREQLAFALNRSGHPEQAISELESVLEEIPENGETCGLLGRVYKDRWEALGGGRSGAARAALEKAIDWYRRGLAASREEDPYCGVNALTLLAVKGTRAARQAHARLLPRVEAATGRRLEARPSYWDLASMLEVAANKRNQGECVFYLRLALAAPHDAWQLETTARNLGILRKAPGNFQRAAGWLESIERDLIRGRVESAAQSW